MTVGQLAVQYPKYAGDVARVAPCPVCRTVEHITVEAPNPYDTSMLQAFCDGCYDADCVGDPPRYVSMSLTAWGSSFANVVDEWNDLVADAAVKS